MADNKETIKVMQCAAELLEFCVSDPDPKAQEKCQEEFNCLNCDSHSICVAVLEGVVS